MFTSTVRADQLRFRAPPRTAVRFSGPPDRVERSTSRRTHLPEPVRPGVVYRGVRVVYRLSNRLRGRATALLGGSAAPTQTRAEAPEKDSRARPHEQAGRRRSDAPYAEPEARPDDAPGSPSEAPGAPGPSGAGEPGTTTTTGGDRREGGCTDADGHGQDRA